MSRGFRMSPEVRAQRIRELEASMTPADLAFKKVFAAWMASGTYEPKLLEAKEEPDKEEGT